LRWTLKLVCSVVASRSAAIHAASLPAANQLRAASLLLAHVKLLPLLAVVKLPLAASQILAAASN
jgi:hypothetical protein